jgi:hypothetical protein
MIHLWDDRGTLWLPDACVKSIEKEGARFRTLVQAVAAFANSAHDKQHGSLDGDWLQSSLPWLNHISKCAT